MVRLKRPGKGIKGQEREEWPGEGRKIQEGEEWPGGGRKRQEGNPRKSVDLKGREWEI